MTNRFHRSTQPRLKRELMRALFLFVSSCLVLLLLRTGLGVLRRQERQRLQ